MKLAGFINGAYKLDSVNADSQRCVNLYPESIQSGTGKGAQPAYLKSTPGLDLFQTVGSGPIRCIHRDALGRIMVASLNELYRVTPNAEFDWFLYSEAASSTTLDQSTNIDTGTDVFTIAGNTWGYTGQRVRVSSDGTLPTGTPTISSSTDYYIIRLTSTTFQLASSLANALASTYIDVTAAGAGTLTITEQVRSSRSSVHLYSDVDYSTNIITTTGAHNLDTGDLITVGSYGCPLPGGLDFSTSFYIIYNSTTSFKIATSLANADAGTAIDLTEDETGTYYVGQIADLSTDDPDSQPFNFDTSSGAIIARSSTTDNTYLTATTYFTDGTSGYASFMYGAGQPIHTEANTEFLGVVFSPSHVAWIDGFYILNEVGTGNFYISAQNNISIDPLDYSISDGSPDLIMGLIEVDRDLWIFNERSTEILVNTGNAGFPFERVGGGFFEIGCIAKYSISKMADSVFWLGRSEFGQGVVYMSSGIRPQRISTHAIEQAFAGYADMSTATSYCYEWKGHYFYVLNFAEATWVYDLNTKLWHEWAYTNAGTLERHRSNCFCFNPSESQFLVGDYENGKVFTLSDTTYDDNTDAITRLRVTPHYSNELERMFCDELQLDMETGVGLASGQGSDPQVMLDWSDDGGHTWSDESWTSAGGQSGGIGEYSTRVRWRRLGRFRDRIFRFKVTDPVKVVFIDAFMKIRGGKN